MRKTLSVATLAALLLAQQGSVVEALAQSFRAPLPAEGARVLALPAPSAPLAGIGGGAVLPGLIPAFDSSLSAFAAAPSIAAASAAAPAAAEAAGAAKTAAIGSVVDGAGKTEAAPEAAPETRWDWASLSRMFTGARTDRGEPAASELASLRGAQAIIARPGKEAIVTTFGRLDEAFAADPALKESLNKKGRVRLIVPSKGGPGALSARDKGALQAGLAGYGVARVPEVEKIYIDGGRREGGAAADAVKLPLSWRRAVAELLYPFKTLRSSFVVPTKHEVGMAVVFKFFPLTASIGFLHHTYAAHPIAFWTVVGISLGIDVFHGVFGTTWTIFQDKLFKQRGTAYQTVFNLFYGQLWGFLYRLVAWTVLLDVAPPWSAQFGMTVWTTIVFGTFFGTLGWQGTNALYDHGNLNRWQRALILQLRDVKMAISGVLFATNSMYWFWIVFWSQQIADFSILYLPSRLVRARTVLYVVDEQVARTPDFRRDYGSLSAPPETGSPLEKAWAGVTGSPWMLPIVWPLRKLRGFLRRAR